MELKSEKEWKVIIQKPLALCVGAAVVADGANFWIVYEITEQLSNEKGVTGIRTRVKNGLPHKMRGEGLEALESLYQTYYQYAIRLDKERILALP